MNIYDKIAKNIKYYRKLKGLTQSELADLTGYSYGHIRRIEAPNVKKTFTIETVYIISIALNIDITCLFDEPK